MRVQTHVRDADRTCKNARAHTRTHTRAFARSFSSFCLSSPLSLTGILPCPSRFSTIYFTLQLLSSHAFPSLLRTIASISRLERYSFSPPSFLIDYSHFFSILFIPRIFLHFYPANFHRYIFSLYQFLFIFPFLILVALRIVTSPVSSSLSKYTGMSLSLFLSL